MPFVLNEDAAIKAKFAGLTVRDEGNATRPVAVRFRLPETELADATFPMIVIDPAQLSVASEREHRGAYALPYIPEEEATKSFNVRDRNGNVVAWNPPTSDVDVTLSPVYVADYPIPYNLDYQVTVYARKQAHLTQLVGKLSAIDRIPHRFGYVTVPQTGTVQTMDLLGGPELTGEKDRDGKRIFRAHYSVRVVSELNLYGYQVFDSDHVIETVDLNMEQSPEPLG